MGGYLRHKRNNNSLQPRCLSARQEAGCSQGLFCREGGGGGFGGSRAAPSGVAHRNKYSSEWKHSAQKWCNGWPLPASIGC